MNKVVEIKYLKLGELGVSRVANAMKAKNIKNNTIRRVIKVQALVRGVLVRARFSKYKRNLRSAIKIQAFTRGYFCRKKLWKRMSPMRWSSPSRKEKSYCRDIKIMLTKVRAELPLDGHDGGGDRETQGGEGVP